MRVKKRKDSIDNKKTLNFLIYITEILKSSNAILGRNNEMFAVDTNKIPKLLISENADLPNLFIERKLVVDHEEIFGVMRVVTGSFTENNITFYDIADSLSSQNHKDDECYPFHREVRNWFLSIPQFSKKDKDKYEVIYQKIKIEISELMHENAEDLYKAIFSFNENIVNHTDERKPH